MKILKILIVIAFFAVSHQVSAQLLVNNNTAAMTGYRAIYDFGTCGSSTMFFTTGSTPGGTACASSSLNWVAIEVVDPCGMYLPWYSVTLTPSLPTQQYVCGGITYTFTLTITAGGQMIVDIDD